MKKLNIVILLLFLGLTTSLIAQESDKKNREKDPSIEIANASLAVELVNYGYSMKSPLSLIEAAKILSEKPLKKLNITKSEPSTGAEGIKKTKVANYTPANLLVDAKTFANGNKTILALISEVEKSLQSNGAVASKGRLYGPAYVERKVYPSSSYVDYILFKGDEQAEVLIVGDGDNDLDLYVYNENGELVGSDTDYSDRCYVSFYPYYTKSYKIVVKNRGTSVYSNYVLMSN